ncbi:MAG: PEP-CTERM sorting domain-containing protein, partial [Vicinamibacterales bacterium]
GPLAAFVGPSGVAPVGISELALAPAGFPSGVPGGLYVSFYGSGPAGSFNTNNPLLYVDLLTGSYVPFVPAGLDGIGHLTSLLATSQALFVADFSSTGYYDAASGTVYRITAAAPVPEPATMALVLAGLPGLGVALLRARRRSVKTG